jgi:hypothetical protein
MTASRVTGSKRLASAVRSGVACGVLAQAAINAIVPSAIKVRRHGTRPAYGKRMTVFRKSMAKHRF